MKQDVLISLTYCMTDNLIPHNATIDIKILHISLATREGWQTYPAP